MYIKNTFKNGNIFDIEKVHTHKFHPKDFHAEKNKTSLAQEKVNSRNAAIEFRRKVHENFGFGSFHVICKYDRLHRTEDLQVARHDIQNFMRNLRGLFKRKGVELKYVYISEYGKRGNNIHHHVILSAEGIPTHIIASYWKYGSITFVPFDNTGDYRVLTDYLIKQADSLYQDEKGLWRKRWNASRNLVNPSVKREIVKADSWREDPVIPKGFMLLPDSLRVGVTEVTGYPYQYYSIIRIPGVKIKPPKRTYRLRKNKKGVEVIGSSGRKNHSES
ncbi:MAG: hypothetical protein AB9883_07855 [Acidaminococcaceae bacterium]